MYIVPYSYLLSTINEIIEIFCVLYANRECHVTRKLFMFKKLVERPLSTSTMRILRQSETGCIRGKWPGFSIHENYFTERFAELAFIRFYSDLSTLFMLREYWMYINSSVQHDLNGRYHDDNN